MSTQGSVTRPAAGIPSPEDLPALNEQFATAHPREILQWVDQTFPHGSAVLGTGFGAEGVVLIDLVVSLNRSIPIFFIDTGVLFPETYRLRTEIEKHYGISIQRYAPELSLEQQAMAYGDELWKRDPDLCCALRKVQPLDDALRGRKAWITGVRRSQSTGRRAAQLIEWDAVYQVVKVNPLANLSKEQIWDYIRTHLLLYNPLYDRGYASIGCFHCTSPVREGEDERAGRWRGFQKTECGLHRRYQLAQKND
jgi:phosphoadenosine phosphosulfate reductase